MGNEFWGVNLPPRDTSAIALNYGVRILGIDETMANFIYAVKTMRQYAIDTFGGWAPTGGASLCGLHESKDFCEEIRGKARDVSVCNILVTLPVGANISRERAMVTLCAVLGLMGIAYHITSVGERFA